MHIFLILYDYFVSLSLPISLSEQMRQILKYRSSTNTFSTLKEMITNKIKQMKEFEDYRGVEFQHHLKNLVLGTQQKTHKVKTSSRLYQKACVTAARPVETILKQFLDRSKKYTEEQLVQTTVYLGKAYQLSLMDHGGHLDRWNYKLYQSPIFDHFIEEVKYALSSQAYIENKNIAKVLDGLGEMNYIDYDVVRLVIQKIEKILSLKADQRIKFQSRLYQTQKKDYYKPTLIGLDQALLNHQFFTKNLAYFQDKKKQYSKKQVLTNIQIEQFGGQQNYEDFVQLISQFDKFNKGTDKILEAIIAIRRQYRKMVTIASQQKVIRNPQLNSSTLLLQQKLLQMHLITLQDIKQPQNYNIQKQNKKVENILKYFMSEANVQNFEDYFVEQQPNLDYLKQLKQKQLFQFACVLQSLAKYVSQPFKLRGSDDSVSLLNVKWQRFMLQQKFKQNNLNVQKMFRRAFVQTQMFISRNLTLLQLSFIEANLKSKLRWYSSLIDLGFIQGVYYQFKSLKPKPYNLEQLNEQQIFTLTKILNNSYQKQFTLSNLVHKYLETRLMKIIDEEEYSPSISQYCEAINYLYQAQIYQKQSLNKQLYRKLIQKLSQQVRYIDQSSTCNKRLAIQAKRILYFQDPENSQYTGSISILNQLQDLRNQKLNPYLKVLYQSIKSVNSNSNQAITTPYITTGVNDNNQITGIYIANFDASSFQGQLVTGHINAYCLRLHKKFGIRVHPVPLTKFMNIKYPENYTDCVSKDMTLSLKSSQDILSALQPYLKRNNQILTDFIKKLSQFLSQNTQIQPSKSKKILSTLIKITQSYNSQKQIITIDQYYVKRCQLLVQFNLLKRDIQLLTKQQLNNLSQQLNQNQNQNQNQLSQKPKNLQLILSKIQKQLQKPLAKIQHRFRQIQQSNKNSQFVNFKGKRITMNLLQNNKDQSSVIENVQQELLSVPYLLDCRYVEYQDWENKIKNTVGYHQIKLQNASQLTKLLVMKFCPYAKDTIVALPQKQGQFFVPFYPLNWQQKYYYHSQNAQQKNHLQKVAQTYRQAYINVKQNNQIVDKNLIVLQNLKHQLKATKSPKQILDTIVNFSFINKLLQDKLQTKSQSQAQSQSQSTATFIQRDAKQYFTYLQRKSDKLYLQSPYLQYIFNKIQQSQSMKQKIKQRKQNKIKLQMLYNQGVINRKTYFDNVKEIDLQLIQQMKKMKKKVLTHIDGVQVLEDGSKIVQFNQNLGELERIVHAGYWYDKDQDVDLVAAGGDFAQALKIKRAKAQTNLILYRILALRSAGKELSAKEKKFVENWKNSVVSGISTYQFNKNYTKLSLKQLQSSDFQLLKLPNTNIYRDCPNLALSDFILEISNFFDQSIIHRLQSQIYSQHFSQKYKVPSSIFATSSNKIFKSLAYKAEDAIFQKNSKLNQRQIDCLIQMSKIFKTQALSSRQKYNIHYKNIRQDLQLINNCRYRNPLSAQYLKQKDYQYYNNYFPKQTTQLKQKQLSKLWKNIFQKQQQQTSSTKIRMKVSQICQRMLYIKLNTPPFFGNLVLAILKNQNTDNYTKQKLIAYIELFKVQLKIDSEDLLGLAIPENIELEKIMGEMRKYNSENFVKKVYNWL